MFKIYIIKNTVNPKVYIGYTSLSLKRRFQNHCYSISSEKGKCKFQRACLKHGIDNFYIEQLDECESIDFAIIKEQYYISLYNSYKDGYNSTIGGWSQKESGKANYSETSLTSFREKQKEWLDSDEGLKFRERASERMKNNKIHLLITDEGRCSRNKKFTEWQNNTVEGINLKRHSSERMKQLSKVFHMGEYELLDPSNQLYRTENILSFCKNFNLSYHSFNNILKGRTFYEKVSGKNKGWRIIKWVNSRVNYNFNLS